MKFHVVVIVYMVSMVCAHSGGKLDELCTNTDLMRRNGVAPIDHQVSLPPYSVTASQQNYQPKTRIAVSIRSIEPATFRGFAIAAFDETKQPIGSWIPVKGLYQQLRDCPVAINVNNINKVEVTLVWEAPNDTNGVVNFGVTVFKDERTYWIRLPVKYLS